MISIILAGGSSSRLWPFSRKFWPKFLLKFNKEKYSLLQRTFLRVKRFTEIKDIYIVVNDEHKFLVKENIKELNVNFPLENIISEPDIKNTLPAVTLSCSLIREKYSDDQILCVFPADHIIEPENKFYRVIGIAEKLASIGFIVLLGIKPNRIEAGYGYIEFGEKICANKFFGDAYKVCRFIEKPSYEVAKNLIKKNNVCWNSGIFVFKASIFFEELSKFQKNLYKMFSSKNLRCLNLKKIYKKITPISIDKGLIEKTHNIVMLKTDDIFWDDMGSWSSMERLYKKNQYGNIILAENFDMLSKNIVVISNTNRTIATCGLENLIIVDTEDALLVVNKKQEQKVKDIVNKINGDVVLYHKTTQRPWGFYTILKQMRSYKVKIVNIYPTKSLNMQKHKKRIEQIFVVNGMAKVTVGQRVVILKKGQTLKIEKNVVHKLENPSKTKFLEIVELSYGNYLGEDDIVYLEK
ncbi:MAG: mannose-1-phosphate guanylyltransferase/mannose-6-phosphate isomerase [Endomicrobia bacterium]|nr:mannose-1-phosphate guanylyltransferase/mannose-6-phosphate isomerase [Endomicrobiia bacterium]